MSQLLGLPLPSRGPAMQYWLLAPEYVIDTVMFCGGLMVINLIIINKTKRFYKKLFIHILIITILNNLIQSVVMQINVHRLEQKIKV